MIDKFKTRLFDCLQYAVKVKNGKSFTKRLAQYIGCAATFDFAARKFSGEYFVFDRKYASLKNQLHQLILKKYINVYYYYGKYYFFTTDKYNKSK